MDGSVGTRAITCSEGSRGRALGSSLRHIVSVWAKAALVLLAALPAAAQSPEQRAAQAGEAFPVQAQSTCPPCQPFAVGLLQTRIAIYQLAAARDKILDRLLELDGEASIEDIQAELAKAPPGSALAARLQGMIAKREKLEAQNLSLRAALQELERQKAVFQALLSDCEKQCVPAGKQPVPPGEVARPLILVRRAGGLPTHTVLRDEAFQIEVRLPGPNPPPEVTVQIFTGEGLLDEVTLEEAAPGTGAYLSAPMTSRADLDDFITRYRTTVTEGRAVTVSAAGAQSTFKVYSTDLKAEIGQNTEVFEDVRRTLQTLRVAALDALRAPELTNIADPEAIRRRAKLQDLLAIVDGRLEWMEMYDTSMAALAGQGDYRIVEWQREYLWLLGDDPRNGLPSWFGQATNLRISGRRNDVLMKVYRELAHEVYALAVGASIDAVLPFTSLFTHLTGKDIYGEQVDVAGYKGNIKALGFGALNVGLSVGINRCMAPVKSKAGGKALSTEKQTQIRQQTARELQEIKAAGKAPAAASSRAASAVEALDDAALLERSVKAKAALEVEGKPQTWTRAEHAKLQDMIFSSDDATLTKAAGKELRIVDAALEPVIQAELAGYRATPPSSRPAGAPRERRPASDFAGTGAEGKPAQIARFDPDAEFVDFLNADTLRAEIARKIQTRAAAAERARAAALQDQARAFVDSAAVEKLTREQVRGLSPEEIRLMSPEARAALPVGELSGPQLRALAELEGLGGGSGPLVPGFWYWPLGQLFVSPQGRLALTGPGGVTCGTLLYDGRIELDSRGAARDWRLATASGPLFDAAQLEELFGGPVPALPGQPPPTQDRPGPAEPAPESPSPPAPSTPTAPTPPAPTAPVPPPPPPAQTPPPPPPPKDCTALSGTFVGKGDCRIGSTTLSVAGSVLTFSGFGAGVASATFNASGRQAQAFGLVIRGKPNHHCTLTCDPPDRFTMECTNPEGGSCKEVFTKR